MNADPTSGSGPEPDRITRRFTTEAQLAERKQVGKRFAWALVVALAGVLAVVLFGPAPDPNDPLLQHYGVQGELMIMPEVSIDDGQDQVHQLPKTLTTPPPPSQIEVEPEDLSEKATEVRPENSDLPIDVVQNDSPNPDPNAEVAVNEQVELRLPQQNNPDWYILHQEWAEYPLAATENELRMSVIFVKVAIFVGPDGTVSDAMVQATNGSAAFTDEVLKKVSLWEFGWRVPPGAGRWITMTWNFKSPYYKSNY